jgi:hypothetical protein
MEITASSFSFMLLPPFKCFLKSDYRITFWLSTEKNHGNVDYLFFMEGAIMLYKDYLKSQTWARLREKANYEYKSPQTGALFISAAHSRWEKNPAHGGGAMRRGK